MAAQGNRRILRTKKYGEWNWQQRYSQSSLVRSLSAQHGKSFRITLRRSVNSIFEPSLPLTQNVANV